MEFTDTTGYLQGGGSAANDSIFKHRVQNTSDYSLFMTKNHCFMLSQGNSVDFRIFFIDMPSFNSTL